MQFDKQYENTEAWKAVTFRQPDADDIMNGAKEKFRKRSTQYRGELLIVSAPGKGEREGCTICLVELTDVRPTDKGYIWHFSNPRRVIEYPAQKSTMKGEVWDCFMYKGEIMEYPTHIKIPIKFKKK